MKKLLILVVVLLTLLVVWQVNLVSAEDGIPLRCSPGTGSPGYWKNHPDAWPVDEIEIGGVIYTKDDAIGIMNTSVKGDKTYTLFPALVAAKLNVLVIGDIECCVGCVLGAISKGDQWMKNHPPGSGVEASSYAWPERGECVYLILDDYNRGELCAPSRDAFEE
jgi:hypothetical protein